MRIAKISRGFRKINWLVVLEKLKPFLWPHKLAWTKCWLWSDRMKETSVGDTYGGGPPNKYTMQPNFEKYSHKYYVPTYRKETLSSWWTKPHSYTQTYYLLSQAALQANSLYQYKSWDCFFVQKKAGDGTWEKRWYRKGPLLLPIYLNSSSSSRRETLNDRKKEREELFSHVIMLLWKDNRKKEEGKWQGEG